MCLGFLTCRKCTGQKPMSQLYTPEKHPVNQFKKDIRLAAARVYRGPLLIGPLDLSIVFMFARPKNKQWKQKEMPREWSDKIPDFDNLAKSVADALTGLIYPNDKLVSQGLQQKFMASGAEKEMLAVKIESLKDQPPISWADELIKAEMNW